MLDLCKYRSSGPCAAQVERSGPGAVRLRKPPEVGPLSPAELTILEDVAKQFHDRDQWDLSTLMHGFPEWKDARGARVEIPPDDILAAVGKTPEQIREILDEAAEEAQVVATFGA